MVLKQYQGGFYLVSTLNTTTVEIKEQIEESKGKVHLNLKTVFSSVDEFASVKDIESYVSFSSCRRKISFTEDKKTSVQSNHCFAMANISRLIKSLNVKMELQFDYENGQISCTAFKHMFLNIADFEKLNNDEIGKKVLQLCNIDVGFNSAI